MRILFLTRSFNSLTQRLYLELTALGHEVSVEFDITDAVTIEAVALYRPGADRRALPARAPFPRRSGATRSAWWCTRASSATAGRRRWTGPSPTASASGA